MINLKIHTLFLSLLCHVSGSWGYDVELEGKVHLSDEFVNKMKRGGTKPQEFAQSLIKEVEAMILNSRRSPLESMNIKIPYDLASIFHKALVTRRSSGKDFTSEGESISRFIIYLKEKSAQRIKILGKSLKTDFHFKVVAPLRVKQIKTNYLARMKSYLEVILNEKFDCDLEKEFLLMDIVETSNKILYSEARILLNKFIDSNYASVMKEDIHRATQTIYSKNIESKKEDYKFLCSTLSLCRAYPAFMDYTAELLSELLKVPDTKFNKLLHTTFEVVNREQNLLETTVGAAVKKLSSVMKKLVHSKMGARESLSILRGIITRRHEWIRDRDSHVANKTKALRIFFDILDRAFDMEGELVVAYQFDMTVKAFRDWASGLRNDLETILRDFFTFSATIANKNLTPAAKHELKALSEIINGDSALDDLQRRLFTEGSRYIRYTRTND